MFYVTLLEPEIILKSHHHLLSFDSKIDPFFSKLQRVKITWFLTVCSFWKSPQKSHWSHHTASVVKTASKCEFYNFWKIGIIFGLKSTWDILGDFQTLWSSFQPSMYLVTWRSNLSLLLSSHQSFQWLATLD